MIAEVQARKPSAKVSKRRLEEPPDGRCGRSSLKAHPKLPDRSRSRLRDAAATDVADAAAAASSAAAAASAASPSPAAATTAAAAARAVRLPPDEVATAAAAAIKAGRGTAAALADSAAALRLLRKEAAGFCISQNWPAEGRESSLALLHHARFMRSADVATLSSASPSARDQPNAEQERRQVAADPSSSSHQGERSAAATSPTNSQPRPVTGRRRSGAGRRRSDGAIRAAEAETGAAAATENATSFPSLPVAETSAVLTTTQSIHQPRTFATPSPAHSPSELTALVPASPGDMEGPAGPCWAVPSVTAPVPSVTAPVPSVTAPVSSVTAPLSAPTVADTLPTTSLATTAADATIPAAAAATAAWVSAGVTSPLWDGGPLGGMIPMTAPGAAEASRTAVSTAFAEALASSAGAAPLAAIGQPSVATPSVPNSLAPVGVAASLPLAAVEARASSIVAKPAARPRAALVVAGSAPAATASYGHTSMQLLDLVSRAGGAAVAHNVAAAEPSSRAPAVALAARPCIPPAHVSGPPFAGVISSAAAPTGPCVRFVPPAVGVSPPPPPAAGIVPPGFTVVPPLRAPIGVPPAAGGASFSSCPATFVVPPDGGKPHGSRPTEDNTMLVRLCQTQSMLGRLLSDEEILGLLYMSRLMPGALDSLLLPAAAVAASGTARQPPPAIASVCPAGAFSMIASDTVLADMRAAEIWPTNARAVPPLVPPSVHGARTLPALQPNGLMGTGVADARAMPALQPGGLMGTGVADARAVPAVVPGGGVGVRVAVDARLVDLRPSDAADVGRSTAADVTPADATPPNIMLAAALTTPGNAPGSDACGGLCAPLTCRPGVPVATEMLTWGGRRRAGTQRADAARAEAAQPNADTTPADVREPDAGLASVGRLPDPTFSAAVAMPPGLSAAASLAGPVSDALAVAMPAAATAAAAACDDWTEPPATAVPAVATVATAEFCSVVSVAQQADDAAFRAADWLDDSPALEPAEPEGTLIVEACAVGGTAPAVSASTVAVAPCDTVVVRSPVAADLAQAGTSSAEHVAGITAALPSLAELSAADAASKSPLAAGGAEAGSASPDHAAGATADPLLFPELIVAEAASEPPLSPSGAQEADTMPAGHQGRATADAVSASELGVASESPAAPGQEGDATADSVSPAEHGIAAAASEPSAAGGGAPIDATSAGLQGSATAGAVSAGNAPRSDAVSSDLGAAGATAETFLAGGELLVARAGSESPAAAGGAHADAVSAEQQGGATAVPVSPDNAQAAAISADLGMAGAEAGIARDASEAPVAAGDAQANIVPADLVMAGVTADPSPAAELDVARAVSEAPSDAVTITASAMRAARQAQYDTATSEPAAAAATRHAEEAVAVPGAGSALADTPTAHVFGAAAATGEVEPGVPAEMIVTTAASNAGAATAAVAESSFAAAANANRSARTDPPTPMEPDAAPAADIATSATAGVRTAARNHWATLQTADGRGVSSAASRRGRPAHSLTTGAAAAAAAAEASGAAGTNSAQQQQSGGVDPQQQQQQAASGKASRKRRSSSSGLRLMDPRDAHRIRANRASAAKSNLKKKLAAGGTGTQDGCSGDFSGASISMACSAGDASGAGAPSAAAVDGCCAPAASSVVPCGATKTKNALPCVPTTSTTSPGAASFAARDSSMCEASGTIVQQLRSAAASPRHGPDSPRTCGGDDSGGGGGGFATSSGWRDACRQGPGSTICRRGKFLSLGFLRCRGPPSAIEATPVEAVVTVTTDSAPPPGAAATADAAAAYLSVLQPRTATYRCLCATGGSKPSCQPCPSGDAAYCLRRCHLQPAASAPGELAELKLALAGMVMDGVRWRSGDGGVLEITLIVRQATPGDDGDENGTEGTNQLASSTALTGGTMRSKTAGCTAAAAVVTPAAAVHPATASAARTAAWDGRHARDAHTAQSVAGPDEHVAEEASAPTAQLAPVERLAAETADAEYLAADAPVAEEISQHLAAKPLAAEGPADVRFDAEEHSAVDADHLANVHGGISVEAEEPATGADRPADEHDGGPVAAEQFAADADRLVDEYEGEPSSGQDLAAEQRTAAEGHAGELSSAFEVPFADEPAGDLSDELVDQRADVCADAELDAAGGVAAPDKSDAAHHAGAAGAAAAAAADQAAVAAEHDAEELCVAAAHLGAELPAAQDDDPAADLYAATAQLTAGQAGAEQYAAEFAAAERPAAEFERAAERPATAEGRAGDEQPPAEELDAERFAAEHAASEAANRPRAGPLVVENAAAAGAGLVDAERSAAECLAAACGVGATAGGRDTAVAADGDSGVIAAGVVAHVTLGGVPGQFSVSRSGVVQVVNKALTAGGGGGMGGDAVVHPSSSVLREQHEAPSCSCVFTSASDWSDACRQGDGHRLTRKGRFLPLDVLRCCSDRAAEPFKAVATVEVDGAMQPGAYRCLCTASGNSRSCQPCPSGDAAYCLRRCYLQLAESAPGDFAELRALVTQKVLEGVRWRLGDSGVLEVTLVLRQVVDEAVDPRLPAMARGGCSVPSQSAAASGVHQDVPHLVAAAGDPSAGGTGVEGAMAPDGLDATAASAGEPAASIAAEPPAGGASVSGETALAAAVAAASPATAVELAVNASAAEPCVAFGDASTSLHNAAMVATAGETAGKSAASTAAATVGDVELAAAAVPDARAALAAGTVFFAVSESAGVTEAAGADGACAAHACTMQIGTVDAEAEPVGFAADKAGRACRSAVFLDCAGDPVPMTTVTPQSTLVRHVSGHGFGQSLGGRSCGGGDANHRGNARSTLGANAKPKRRTVAGLDLREAAAAAAAHQQQQQQLQQQQRPRALLRYRLGTDEPDSRVSCLDVVAADPPGGSGAVAVGRVGGTLKLKWKQRVDKEQDVSGPTTLRSVETPPPAAAATVASARDGGTRGDVAGQNGVEAQQPLLDAPTDELASEVTVAGPTLQRTQPRQAVRRVGRPPLPDLRLDPSVDPEVAERIMSERAVANQQYLDRKAVAPPSGRHRATKPAAQQTPTTFTPPAAAQAPPPQVAVPPALPAPLGGPVPPAASGAVDVGRPTAEAGAPNSAPPASGNAAGTDATIIDSLRRRSPLAADGIEPSHEGAGPFAVGTCGAGAGALHAAAAAVAAGRCHSHGGASDLGDGGSLPAEIAAIAQCGGALAQQDTAAAAATAASDHLSPQRALNGQVASPLQRQESRGSGCLMFANSTEWTDACRQGDGHKLCKQGMYLPLGALRCYGASSATGVKPVDAVVTVELDGVVQDAAYRCMCGGGRLGRQKKSRSLDSPSDEAVCGGDEGRPPGSGVAGAGVGGAGAKLRRSSRPTTPGGDAEAYGLRCCYLQRADHAAGEFAELREVVHTRVLQGVRWRIGSDGALDVMLVVRQAQEGDAPAVVDGTSGPDTGGKRRRRERTTTAATPALQTADGLPCPPTAAAAGGALSARVLEDSAPGLDPAGDGAQPPRRSKRGRPPGREARAAAACAETADAASHPPRCSSRHDDDATPVPPPPRSRHHHHNPTAVAVPRGPATAAAASAPWHSTFRTAANSIPVDSDACLVSPPGVPDNGLHELYLALSAEDHVVCPPQAGVQMPSAAGARRQPDLMQHLGDDDDGGSERWARGGHTAAVINEWGRAVGVSDPLGGHGPEGSDDGFGFAVGVETWLAYGGAADGDGAQLLHGLDGPSAPLGAGEVRPSSAGDATGEEAGAVGGSSGGGVSQLLLPQLPPFDLMTEAGQLFLQGRGGGLLTPLAMANEGGVPPLAWDALDISQLGVPPMLAAPHDAAAPGGVPLHVNSLDAWAGRRDVPPPPPQRTAAAAVAHLAGPQGRPPPPATAAAAAAPPARGGIDGLPCRRDALQLGAAFAAQLEEQGIEYLVTTRAAEHLGAARGLTGDSPLSSFGSLFDSERRHRPERAGADGAGGVAVAGPLAGEVSSLAPPRGAGGLAPPPPLLHVLGTRLPRASPRGAADGVNGVFGAATALDAHGTCQQDSASRRPTTLPPHARAAGTPSDAAAAAATAGVGVLAALAAEGGGDSEGDSGGRPGRGDRRVSSAAEPVGLGTHPHVGPNPHAAATTGYARAPAARRAAAHAGEGPAATPCAPNDPHSAPARSAASGSPAAPEGVGSLAEVDSHAAVQPPLPSPNLASLVGVDVAEPGNLMLNYSSQEVSAVRTAAAANALVASNVTAALHDAHLAAAVGGMLDVRGPSAAAAAPRSPVAVADGLVIRASAQRVAPRSAPVGVAAPGPTAAPGGAQVASAGVAMGTGVQLTTLSEVPVGVAGATLEAAAAGRLALVEERMEAADAVAVAGNPTVAPRDCNTATVAADVATGAGDRTESMLDSRMAASSSEAAKGASHDNEHNGAESCGEASGGPAEVSTAGSSRTSECLTLIVFQSAGAAAAAAAQAAGPASAKRSRWSGPGDLAQAAEADGAATTVLDRPRAAKAAVARHRRTEVAATPSAAEAWAQTTEALAKRSRRSGNAGRAAAGQQTAAVALPDGATTAPPAGLPGDFASSAPLTAPPAAAAVVLALPAARHNADTAAPHPAASGAAASVSFGIATATAAASQRPGGVTPDAPLPLGASHDASATASQPAPTTERTPATQVLHAGDGGARSAARRTPGGGARDASHAAGVDTSSVARFLPGIATCAGGGGAPAVFQPGNSGAPAAAQIVVGAGTASSGVLQPRSGEVSAGVEPATGAVPGAVGLQAPPPLQHQAAPSGTKRHQAAPPLQHQAAPLAVAPAVAPGRGLLPPTTAASQCVTAVAPPAVAALAPHPSAVFATADAAPDVGSVLCSDGPATAGAVGPPPPRAAAFERNSRKRDATGLPSPSLTDIAELSTPMDGPPDAAPANTVPDRRVRVRIACPTSKPTAMSTDAPPADVLPAAEPRNLLAGVLSAAALLATAASDNGPSAGFPPAGLPPTTPAALPEPNILPADVPLPRVALPTINIPPSTLSLAPSRPHSVPPAPSLEGAGPTAPLRQAPPTRGAIAVPGSSQPSNAAAAGVVTAPSPPLVPAQPRMPATPHGRAADGFVRPPPPLPRRAVAASANIHTPPPPSSEATTLHPPAFSPRATTTPAPALPHAAPAPAAHNLAGPSAAAAYSCIPAGLSPPAATAAATARSLGVPPAAAGSGDPSPAAAAAAAATARSLAPALFAALQAEVTEHQTQRSDAVAALAALLGEVTRQMAERNSAAAALAALQGQAHQQLAARSQAEASLAVLQTEMLRQQAEVIQKQAQCSQAEAALVAAQNEVIRQQAEVIERQQAQLTRR